MRHSFAGWKKSLLRRALIFALELFCCYFVVAQGGGFSWDFSDCEIKDILFAVSLDTGISIVPDDTVSGKGDLKFSGDNFDSAFEAFLKTNRLYVKREEKFWTVSKFMLIKENGLISFDAYDLYPVQIVEKLSEEIDCVLTYDSLPMQKISIHIKDVSEAMLFESLAKRFGEYEVREDEYSVHFSKKNTGTFSSSGALEIEKSSSGEFLVNIHGCNFSEAVEKLFSLNAMPDVNGALSFCVLSDTDCKLQRSVFVSVDFADALSKLCSLGGYDFVHEDEMYYIFARPESKTELVSGKRTWRKFSLCFTKSQDLLPLIFKRTGKLATIVLPDEVSFLCLSSEKENEEIQELISCVDIKQSTYVVNLKFIKPQELMEHLPPDVEKSSLFLADDSESLYFRGTEESYKSLCAQLELCDRPVKRISYDLLILQYDETSQNSWTSSFDVRRMLLGDRNNISAVLGSVMGFNLNVVTSFGLTFAADLQNSIEENKTRVYADTTLHGVSGKEIHFQNTNTYRYRDNNVDPQTGTPVYSGVTREIISGIRLDILGWVSGDGMINSKVTASVSRRGTDTSAKTGNPPPTSEKIVTTEVRGKNGEPVVLSGLVQNAESEQEKRAPFISKIPLIGNLFKTKNKTKENSQMIIYLVPHTEDVNVYGERENNSETDLYSENWGKQRIKKIIELCSAMEGADD